MNNEKIEQEFIDFCKNDLEFRGKIEVIALLNSISVVLIRKGLTTEEELNDLKEQSFNEVLKLYKKQLTDEDIENIKIVKEFKENKVRKCKICGDYIVNYKRSSKEYCGRPECEKERSKIRTRKSREKNKERLNNAKNN